MEEIWKDIQGYEGLYQVSNMGRVYSISYKKCLSARKCRGYLSVLLHKKGERKHYLVHRLVAETFILNPNNYPQVNHKDENKLNNHVNNLEWCTREYNMNYGTRTERARKSLKGKYKPGEHYNLGRHLTKEQRMKVSKSKYKKVVCVTTGEIFDAVIEVARKYNIDRSSISACCRGKVKSAGKHPVTGEKLVWKYIED